MLSAHGFDPLGFGDIKIKHFNLVLHAMLFRSDCVGFLLLASHSGDVFADIVQARIHELSCLYSTKNEPVCDRGNTTTIDRYARI